MESDSAPLEGSHFHHFAQKVGTANHVEIASLFNKLAVSNGTCLFGLPASSLYGMGANFWHGDCDDSCQR